MHRKAVFRYSTSDMYEIVIVESVLQVVFLDESTLPRSYGVERAFLGYEDIHWNDWNSILVTGGAATLRLSGGI